jgi:hypothetical protein
MKTQVTVSPSFSKSRAQAAESIPPLSNTVAFEFMSLRTVYNSGSPKGPRSFTSCLAQDSCTPGRNDFVNDLHSVEFLSDWSVKISERVHAVVQPKVQAQ